MGNLVRHCGRPTVELRLFTDASAAVGESTVAEGVNVGLNFMEVNAPCLGSLNNELGLMDALSTRQDLLTTDEEIIAVGELGILRIGHGVERTNGKGVLVHHEKVRAVLLLDNLAKFYLDAMNKVAYHDDSQITKLCVSKIWCEDEYSDGSISVAIKKL